MTKPPTMDHKEILRYELEILRQKHRDLDDAIRALDAGGVGDQLTIRRLKRQKLAMKDQITRIEDQIFPDIIA
ncbi:MAG TPA: DUF465 domain-containing protein [Paracoccaceae bacterium]|nr:DUF465 domain-containing protein [Paracoccaceae bacterium]